MRIFNPRGKVSPKEFNRLSYDRTKRWRVEARRSRSVEGGDYFIQTQLKTIATDEAHEVDDCEVVFNRRFIVESKLKMGL